MSRYSFNNSSEGIEDLKQRLSIVEACLFRDEAVTLVEAIVNEGLRRVTPQPTPVLTSIGWGGQSQPKVALGFCCEDTFDYCSFTGNESSAC